MALLAACSNRRLAIEYDYDGDADFGSLAAWSWISGDRSGSGSDKVDAVVREALTSQLARLGYRGVESGCDFRLGFVLETERKITRRYIDARLGYGSVPYLFGGDGGVETVVEDYVEGTLILDVTLPDAKAPIWRGWAQGAIREGMSDAQIRAEVTEAVRRILEKFPPPATRKNGR